MPSPRDASEHRLENDALRSSLSVVALIALIALFTSMTIPTQQPKGAAP